MSARETWQEVATVNAASTEEYDAGRETQVAEAFVALADTLVDDYDMLDLLDRLVAVSVGLLAADAAGIVLADAREHLTVVAASSDAAELLEMLQLQNDQGPCLDAYRSGAAVSVPDLRAASARWPRFTAAVTALSEFSSVHALPMRLRGQSIGALNLFHHAPGPMPDADMALAQALADVATIGILQERAIRRAEVVAEQLQTALTSRVIIEQAKGVLAHHGGVSMDVAFDRLRSYARGRHFRLTEVARWLVEHELPPGEVVGDDPGA
jgi:GAF domain-containing protein